MYYGSAKHAVDWFGRLGYTLPYAINAADFILDLASSDVATDKRHAFSPTPQPDAAEAPLLLQMLLINSITTGRCYSVGLQRQPNGHSRFCTLIGWTVK